MHNQYHLKLNDFEFIANDLCSQPSPKVRLVKKLSTVMVNYLSSHSLNT